ncbi:MAG: glutamine synthetase family protein [Chitinispirillia bacterium]|nr:glutamine synthetase family protein [Chitinispirillia bacterium]MCL2269527.1 glutamine synthetase family protein [Chitinispirillia bacterium]
MDITTREVLEFVRENDVKFVRLVFCDLFGIQKNIAIMPDELQAAFESGVSFDAHAIKGFRDITESDLFLFPNPSTLAVLPWRPGPGRVVRFLCDVRNPDGTPFSRDMRNILRQTEERCDRMGYICKIGAECEFYLFKNGEDGEPTDVTIDRGGYFDMQPLDKGENTRREICLTLEEMGIKPESSHHERGPGQNEIDFRFGGALSCADNFFTFKSVVKAIAARNGLHASFMPKPIAKAPGSGAHINISLVQNGKNVFKSKKDGHSDVAESFMAGILAKTPEMTLFLNPLANSYERFGEFDAPKYVSWSHQNRSQLVRIPAAEGKNVRMELRSPDPSINPYLAFALILSAGLDGVEKGITLPEPLDVDLYTADKSITQKLVKLPESLDEAIKIAEGSGFIKSVIGEDLLNKYVAIKKDEAAAFADAEDKALFYREKYFYCV